MPNTQFSTLFFLPPHCYLITTVHPLSPYVPKATHTHLIPIIPIPFAKFPQIPSHPKKSSGCPLSLNLSNHKFSKGKFHLVKVHCPHCLISPQSLPHYHTFGTKTKVPKFSFSSHTSQHTPCIDLGHHGDRH